MKTKGIARRLFNGSCWNVVISLVVFIGFHATIYYVMIKLGIGFSDWIDTGLSLCSVFCFLFFGINVFMSLTGNKDKIEKKILKERYHKVESDSQVDYLVK